MAIDIRVPQEPEAPRTLLAADGALCGQAPDISVEQLLGLYQAMSLARRLDEELGRLFKQGRLGFHLSGVGEEAVSAASAHVLGPEDWLFPAFRDLSAYLVRGVPLALLAHQAFGSSRSPTSGHPLPPYFADRSRRIASPGAGGAAHLPHGVGAAWAARLKGDAAVAMVSFNHGAVGSGEFHAALNFAGVFKAPVVFVCRNRADQPASQEDKGASGENGAGAENGAYDGKGASVVFPASIAGRAAGYGFTGSRVDGADILALVATLSAAVEKARSGGGPTLVEVLLGGPGGRDPVDLLRRHLSKRGEWDESREAALQARQRQEVSSALQEAAAAGPPPVESLWADVRS